jgi:hypothetical protein
MNKNENYFQSVLEFFCEIKYIFDVGFWAIQTPLRKTGRLLKSLITKKNDYL